MSDNDVDNKETISEYTYKDQPMTPQLLVFDIKSPTIAAKRPSHVAKPPLNKAGSNTERHGSSALKKLNSK